MCNVKDAGPASPKSINFIRTPTAFNAVYNLVMGIFNDKMKQRVPNLLLKLN